MIGKIHRFLIHWFLNINVHDNQSQTWQVNCKEKIGHLQNRCEEKEQEKSVYKIFFVGSIYWSQSIIETESSVKIGLGFVHKQ